MGRREIRGLKTRVGLECSISRGGPRLYSGGIQAGGFRGGSHSVTSGDAAWGEAPGVRAAKSSEFEERERVVSTLDGSIWGRCTIALTCPTRSHFQRTQSRKRWGQVWHERYRSSREEK